MIRYQYRGLPHAHLVAILENGHDIHDPNRDDLINFVERYFVAEMLWCFGGDENQNAFQSASVPNFPEEYKQKAIELVRMQNTHKCAVAANGCKKQAGDICK